MYGTVLYVCEELVTCEGKRKGTVTIIMVPFHC